jgi:8-oxo-dGTP pyrophosphatase MutT (NUDIX family)
LTSPRSSTESPAGRSATERSAGFVLYRITSSGVLEYLVLRHRNGGHWGFPKGRIEPGESELEAAVRETREETGLGDLEIVRGARYQSCYRLLREGTGICKTVDYFVARVASGEAHVSEEHEAMQWLPYREARAALSYEEPRAVLDAAARAVGDAAAQRT